MKQRVITAVAALALFLPIIIWDFGGISVALLASAMAVVGVYELFRMKGLTLMSLEGILSAIGAVILALPEDPWFAFLPEKTSKVMLFYLIVLLLLGMQVVSKNMYTFDEVGFPIVSSMYVGFGFGFFADARAEGLIVLLYGLFIVWATDIGAYMIGRKYGKNKLWPEISPNKTIEGALGGIACALAIAIVYLLVFPANTYFGHNYFVMIGLTIVLSIIGQFGDLVESAIKRHFGVKDSGTILPGHGGILDRFDSMIFVFPMMYLLGIF